VTLAQRINDLLEVEIASPGDGSLLDAAMRDAFPNAPFPSSPAALAFLRVEILLAAWNDLLRDVVAAPLVGLDRAEVGIAIDGVAGIRHPLRTDELALLRKLQAAYEVQTT
jgi:hypothetical protein